MGELTRNGNSKYDSNGDSGSMKEIERGSGVHGNR